MIPNSTQMKEILDAVVTEQYIDEIKRLLTQNHLLKDLLLEACSDMDISRYKFFYASKNLKSWRLENDLEEFNRAKKVYGDYLPAKD